MLPQVDQCTQQNARIKANVKFVEEAVAELLKLPKE